MRALLSMVSATRARGDVRCLHSHRIVALINAPDPFSRLFLRQLQQAGEATGTAIDPVMIRRDDELDAAFQTIARQQPDAVIVHPSLPTKRAAELALEYRIPSACARREFAHDGGLIAYAALEAAMYRHAADLVEKILKGARAAELPVERADSFELTINLKTAKALGITLSPEFIARADEVVE